MLHKLSQAYKLSQADKMPNLTWEGYGRLGPSADVIEEARLGLSKMAQYPDVKCHLKQNYSPEYRNDFIMCTYLHGVRKVVICMRGVVLFLAIADVNDIYRSRLMQYGHLSIHLE